MHNNNYYNDKQETHYETEWLFEVTWTMPTAKHECPFISLHTFKILYFLEFSLIYKIGISSKWSLPSVILSSLLFFFCSSSFSENFAFVPKKKMLSHTTIVIINLFPHSFVLTLETSSKSLDIIMCSTKWYEKKRHSQKKRNVSWSFSLIYIFISLFNISQTKKEIRKEESNKNERRKGKRPSNFDWI